MDSRRAIYRFSVLCLNIAGIGLSLDMPQLHARIPRASPQLQQRPSACSADHYHRQSRLRFQRQVISTTGLVFCFVYYYLIALIDRSRSPDLSVSRLCSASSVCARPPPLSCQILNNLSNASCAASSRSCSYRLLLCACALAQSSGGGAYANAKTVSFTLQVLSQPEL